MTRTAKLKRIVAIVKELNNKNKLYYGDKSIIAGYILNNRI